MESIVVFKLIVTPIAILITVFLAKKWGAFIGGLFAGLPIFSGPISFFITYEQGPDFAYIASYNSLIGLLGCSGTAMVYAWSAHFGAKWWLALPLSVAGYFVTGYFLHFLPDFSVIVIVLAFCSPVFVTVLLPKEEIRCFSTKRPPWILGFQLFCGAFMVYTVTEASKLMGPQWSGTMSCFPIMVVALAPFAHVSSGVYATLVVMRGLAAGWVGIASFSCSVILTVQHWHIAAVYFLAGIVAIVSSLLYSFAAVWFRKKVLKIKQALPKEEAC